MTQYSDPLDRTLPESLPKTTSASWQESRRPAATRPRTTWLEPQPVPRRREKSVADIAAAAVRRANARDCLTILLDATEPMTVAELAAGSGLSRPTVDAVLQELVKAGPISASEPPACHSPGRPARRFVADPSSTLVAGVHVTADDIRCTITDAAGRITARSRTALDPEPSGNRLDAVAEAITAVAAQSHPTQSYSTQSDSTQSDSTQSYSTQSYSTQSWANPALDSGQEGARHAARPPKPRLAMVGLAAPGIIGHDHRMLESLAVPEWAGVDLGIELSQRLGCSVAVENDLKLAALAEHRVSQTADSLIYLRLGRRIALAIMVGGRILQGSHRLAGEIDAQRGMRWTTSYDQGGLNWSTGREAEPLFGRAAAGDQAAIAEIDDFCRQIAPRLATLMLALDPKTVIVGGGLSRAGGVLMDPLRREIDQQLTTAQRPDLVVAELSNDGVAIGATGYAFEQGSEEIFGIAAMPAPWSRLRNQSVTDPRPPVEMCGAQ